ncbi:MAG: arsenate reductase ArsC [Bryobacteraceae bacterium]
MAEGLLRQMAGDRFEVASAGTKPSMIRPEAIEAMREIGISLEGHRSKSVDEFAGKPIDYVITVCDNAKESCPIFPAQTSRSIGPSKIRRGQTKESTSNASPCSGRCEIRCVNSLHMNSTRVFLLRQFERIYRLRRCSCRSTPARATRRIKIIPGDKNPDFAPAAFQWHLRTC